MSKILAVTAKVSVSASLYCSHMWLRRLAANTHPRGGPRPTVTRHCRVTVIQSTWICTLSSLSVSFITIEHTVRAQREVLMCQQKQLYREFTFLEPLANTLSFRNIILRVLSALGLAFTLLSNWTFIIFHFMCTFKQNECENPQKQSRKIECEFGDINLSQILISLVD